MGIKYDFDSVIDRRGTDSIKWDIRENELPMWVADMDFRTAPEIIEAMRNRLDHGIFGYSRVPDGWYSAYMDWWRERHGLEIKREWLVFCTGVIPAISSAVRKLTTPDENVVIQTPVYNVFFNCVKNNGCRVLENPLRYSGGGYSMDLDDLGKKLSDPQTSLMILCNPHNPVGKIWDRETLAEIGRLAAENNVTVISDEIHCDLTEPDKEYVPFASVSDECRKVSITCVAPTKTFNLAGLQTAAVFVPDRHLRHKLWRALNTDEVAEPNAFACAAAEAAFTRGGEWLDALREYISCNRRHTAEYIGRELPELKLVRGEATYLLWIDISAIEKRDIQGSKSRDFCSFLRKQTGLFLTAGSEYGGCGDGFVRMNIACPKTMLEDGLERLKDGTAAYKAEN